MRMNRAASQTASQTETPVYEHIATAGAMRRPALRRALCAAEDSGLITSWTEPAPGYYRIRSPHAEITIERNR